ncbi:MAG: hypothetical protein KF709_08380 [Gemmatimonadaceae bacterium]|nr:hypothetical protein [Gemmatimonadaceae bacterium]
MRRVAFALALGALVLSPLTLDAQGRSAGTGGTGGTARGRPGQRGEAAGRQPSPLPNVRAVTNGMNPATELVDSRRKLKLDDATVTRLRALSEAMDARYAPMLARYDTMRVQANMARNQAAAASAANIGGQAARPQANEEEQALARERIAVLRTVMAEVREQRAKDVEEALAAIPEDKREDAKKILDDQAEAMARTFRRSGAEGAAAAGPAGGAQRRP